MPKRDDAVIKTIRVVCAYERNVNEAFFDNISLVREVAQTMKYDKDGNLVSVKSTGNSEESSVFENGNLTKLTRAEAVSICWHSMGMMTMTVW